MGTLSNLYLLFQILGSGLSASSYYDLVYQASLVDEGPSHGKGGMANMASDEKSARFLA